MSDATDATTGAPAPDAVRAPTDPAAPRDPSGDATCGYEPGTPEGTFHHPV